MTALGLPLMRKAHSVCCQCCWKQRKLPLACVFGLMSVMMKCWAAHLSVTAAGAMVDSVGVAEVAAVCFLPACLVLAKGRSEPVHKRRQKRQAFVCTLKRVLVHRVSGK